MTTSDDAVIALGVGPEPRGGRVLVEDRCARCERVILAHDTAWRSMESVPGLLVTANWCSRTCQDRALPDSTVRRLRARQREET